MLELLESLRGLGRRLARFRHPRQVIQAQLDQKHGWRVGALLGGVRGGIIGMLIFIGPLQSKQMFGVAAFFCLLNCGRLRLGGWFDRGVREGGNGAYCCGDLDFSVPGVGWFYSPRDGRNEQHQLLGVGRMLKMVSLIWTKGIAMPLRFGFLNGLAARMDAAVKSIRLIGLERVGHHK